MTVVPNRILLRGARVVDARGVVAERADVLVEGDRIASISPGRPVHGVADPAGARVIDANGRTLCPGLMNAHTHICLDGGPDPERTLAGESATETAIRAAARLREIVGRGVTTIRDVGGVGGIDIALRHLVERGEIPGPRMLTCGRVITMTGGHGHWMGVEADGPDAVRAAARGQIKAGATALKVMATGGMMTPNQRAGAPQLTVEEMAAAVDEAHKANRIVAAHVESDEGGRNAVLAGVDSIEHGHGIGDATIGLMLARDVALVPTILSDHAIIEGGTEAGIPAFVVEKCRGLAGSLVMTLEAAIAAGVTIAAGNDGGAPLVHGGDICLELELYVRHGMSAQAALASATVNTARLFRLDRVGLVEPGYAADLLLVDGDPLTAIGALQTPGTVIARGTILGG